MHRKYLSLAFLALFLPFSALADSDLKVTGFEDPAFVNDERAAIQRASAAWAQAVGERNPEKIASLYANYISLYATFEDKITNYNDLLNYFTTLAAKDDLNVTFDQEDIRTYGATAVNSGLYTFSYTEDGTTHEVPARFTFVYTLTPLGWVIVDHHSSVLPE